jgi:hypothetical protein
MIPDPFLKPDPPMSIKLIPALIFAGMIIFHPDIHGQKSLTSTEAHFYAEAAISFLTVHDNTTIKKSEAVLMFLETDTSGRVTKINLMADSKEKRSLYGVLRKMKPDDFNSQQVNPGAGDKVVIVPIFSLRYTADKSNYLDKIRMPLWAFNAADSSAIVRESHGYIMVNSLNYIVGQSNRH